MHVLARLCNVAACSCLVAMVAVLGATIVLRPFGVLVPSSEEITTFLMVGMAFFGFVSAYVASVHVRVDTLHRRLPARPRRALEIASHAGAAALCATVAYHSGSLAGTAWKFNDVSDGLISIPMWIPLATLPAGMALLALFLLRDGWRILKGADVRFTVTEKDEAVALALAAATEER